MTVEEFAEGLDFRTMVNVMAGRDVADFLDNPDPDMLFELLVEGPSDPYTHWAWSQAYEEICARYEDNLKMLREDVETYGNDDGSTNGPRGV